MAATAPTQNMSEHDLLVLIAQGLAAGTMSLSGSSTHTPGQNMTEEQLYFIIADSLS